MTNKKYLKYYDQLYTTYSLYKEKNTTILYEQDI